MSAQNTVIRFERGETPHITWAAERKPNGILRLLLNEELMASALDKPNADLLQAELEVTSSINELLS